MEASAETEVKQYISYILALIDAGDWEKFRSYALEPSPAHFRARVNVVAQIPELNGMTFLHAVVKSNPPLELVHEMIEICPEQTAARDCLGRTPLHVAAGSGAATSLINTLAHVCPSACDMQDEDGRTPLHFACDSSCVLFQGDETLKADNQRAPCHDTILCLLSVSLAPVTIEDASKMCPLEYAIMSNASLRTVKLLQHAAVHHLRGPGARMPVSLGVSMSMEATDTSRSVRESDRI